MLTFLVAFVIGSFVQYYFLGGDEQPSMSGYISRFWHGAKSIYSRIAALWAD